MITDPNMTNDEVLMTLGARLGRVGDTLLPTLGLRFGPETTYQEVLRCIEKTSEVLSILVRVANDMQDEEAEKNMQEESESEQA